MNSKNYKIIGKFNLPQTSANACQVQKLTECKKRQKKCVENVEFLLMCKGNELSNVNFRTLDKKRLLWYYIKVNFRVKAAQKSVQSFAKFAVVISRYIIMKRISQ